MTLKQSIRFVTLTIGFQLGLILYCGWQGTLFHWLMGCLNGVFIGLNVTTLAKLRRIAADTD